MKTAGNTVPVTDPVVALVIAGLALLLALGAVIAVAVSFGRGTGGPPTGQSTEVRAGTPLKGAVLGTTVTRLVADDGGEVQDMTCPDTAAVDQGVVTVCHGSISGERWAVVVFFEDDAGRLTLMPV